ncbi:hypothetical protein ACKWTF_005508 [Chironomus riparius]
MAEGKLNSVQEFYKDKTIFITGGSGFMGKVLIEKLLYSCSDLKEVIVLMRPKRGKTAMQRVEDFSKLALFKRIMEEKPEVMKKIVPVWGEITQQDLGLNDEHLNHVVKNTQIVFHFAASLKLEATLKQNVLINLTGTKHVLKMARQMENLVQMVHLSTAFCCEDIEVLEERVYDHPHNPYDLIRCAEWMSEEAMAAMQPDILGSQPNTYTYTKRLSEVLVRDQYSNEKLPVLIVRPSIVSPSFKEPVPGWVDSLNGPPGILLAAGKGVLRSMLINPDGLIEAIPVDACINGILTLTKHVATEKRSQEIPVFNATIHESRRITNGQMFDYAKELGDLYPVSGGLWYPDGSITQNVYVHKVKTFFFQWLPAYFIDFMLLCFGQKRFMVYVQKRIATGLEVLQFFTMRKWNFKSDSFNGLIAQQMPDEYDMFLFDSQYVGDDWEYLKNSMLGARQYCVKEPLSTLPRARLQNKIQYGVHVTCKLLFWYFFISFLLRMTGLMDPLSDFIDSLTSAISRNNSSIVTLNTM